tara:strand:+ start:876 stop:2720 length:1845 start_codon:yes stop_codon:yes gene_type:complete
MKFISILFSGLLLAVSAAAVSAQNYYICDNGDDNNNGRSETTPFQTYEKAMDTFNEMVAGESVLFCRGGVFQAETSKRLFNTKCSASSPCTISDYGDQNKQPPRIIANGVTAMNFQNGGNSLPDGGYVVRNLMLLSQKNEYAGIMLFNEVNDVLVENVHIEGFDIGFYSAGANSPGAGSNQANDRIVLKNSKIINNRQQGWLGGCNDCTIENNHFEGNGFGRAVLYHNVYIDSPVKHQNWSNKNIRFANNTLINSTRINGKCEGVSLVVHGIIRNLEIDGNILKEEVGKVGEHCWGIGVDPGNNLDESFIGIKITNNKLFNMGNLGIGCSSCKDVVISDNMIVDEGGVLRWAISVPSKPEDSLKSENVTISKNTIIANHDLATGISLGGFNKFEAFNNTISLLSTDPRSECIQIKDANADTNVSNNTCNTHTSVNIIDETTQVIEQTEVAEETKIVEEITIVEEEITIDESEILPLIRRPIASANNVEAEIDDEASKTLSSSSRSIVSETTTTSAGRSSGVTSGSSSSSTSSPEIETGVYSYVNAARTESQKISISDTPAEVEPVILTDTTNESPKTRGHSVSVNEVQNIIDNDISGVDESQCRVFARGRCMMM